MCCRPLTRLCHSVLHPTDHADLPVRLRGHCGWLAQVQLLSSSPVQQFCRPQSWRLTDHNLPVSCSNLTKNRSLVFDIVGEGNLPRVTVVRPILHNQNGNPLLLFKRLLLGQSEKLPLILKNNGTIPSQVLQEVEHRVGREKNHSEVRLVTLRSLPSLTFENFFFDVPHTLICVRHAT